MLNIHSHTTFLNLKALTFPPTSLSHKNLSLPFSLHFCNYTSDSTSVAVSYLINTFNFTPKFASKLCSTYKVCFKTTQNPDLVLNFFRNNGFSETQLRNIISKAPWLLSCDPFIRVVPKFEFLLSKGASKSDIVNIVSKNPMVLSPSLENHIFPTYELLYRLLQSDKTTIACVIINPHLLSDYSVPQNITLLLQNGLTDTSIALLLRRQSRITSTNTRCMLKLVEELKDLGFNPSTITFAIALEAKLTVNKPLWEEKVGAFKKWGWSDEDVMVAFRLQPQLQNMMGASLANLFPLLIFGQILVVDELKDLGFNPSKTTFGVALHAKLSVSKTLWKEKVDAFKKWGWSDEDVLEAFRKMLGCYGHCQNTTYFDIIPYLI
ncbi:hypothetical protein L195_g024581 [Trifolium pratense]|uniref:mTERF protein n=1 Tax=Trifolium pratense TaxID=57577 RepID=A0A2K3NE42_TRIPR|nr:hypothetical protein L195_g024581 [Trifolium pratense]